MNSHALMHSTMTFKIKELSKNDPDLEKRHNINLNRLESENMASISPYMRSSIKDIDQNELIFT
jgi:hypothetical protein